MANVSSKNQNIFSDFIKKYKNQPVKFVQDILDEDPDPWQQKVMKESLKTRLLAVKSGHGVGKSTCAAWLMMHHMLCF